MEANVDAVALKVALHAIAVGIAAWTWAGRSQLNNIPNSVTSAKILKQIVAGDDIFMEVVK